MALRGDRNIVETDISFTCDDVAAPGVGVCYHTAGSGIAIGDMSGKVKLASNPSGLVFAGILLTEVVDIDTTRFHTNFMKDQVDQGNKVTVLKKGWVITNKISTGGTSAGDKAYLTSDGSFTKTVSSTGGIAQTPFAGRFDALADEDGYQKISINLPNSI